MLISQNAFRANGKPMSDVPAIVLAGGQGTRLHDLTHSECKPALRFGNHTRIVDFAMCNARNSGVRHVLAATQYRPQTLHRRLSHFWRKLFECRDGRVVLRHGPQITNSAHGYAGTAAAVTANIDCIDELAPDHVLILAADHVYRMDFRAMLTTHLATGADLTVAADAVPVAGASAFGIIDADSSGTIVDFVEKPADPPALPDDPGRAFASMGVYIFRWAALRDALIRDMADESSRHDFGFDLVPRFVAARRAAVHRLGSPVPGAAPYWRDVGTLDAYRAAHVDMVRALSAEEAADRAWPVLPGALGDAGAFSSSGLAAELAPKDARLSFVAAHSVIGRGAHLRESVAMPGSVVGAGSRLYRCIIAPGAVIEPGTVIGEDAQEDARWFRRTPSGTVLVTRQMLSARRRSGARPGGHRLVAAPYPARRLVLLGNMPAGT